MNEFFKYEELRKIIQDPISKTKGSNSYDVSVKVNGTWKSVTYGYVKVNGVWKNVAQTSVKHNGVWVPTAGAPITPGAPNAANFGNDQSLITPYPASPPYIGDSDGDDDGD